MTARLHTLRNGVRLLHDPMPGLETMALSVMVEGGSRWEPADREGWSHLLEHMVFKGAGGRSAREMIEAIENAGAQINAATGHERTSFQVRALKDGLSLGMSVTSDLVFRPQLDAGDLEREKDVIGQEIAEAYDTPDDHVFQLVHERMFAGQPMGRPILGQVQTLAPATRETLEDWRKRLYAPERMIVSAAGAIDEAELMDLAEQWFEIEPPSGSTLRPEPASFVGGVAAEARSIEQANLVWAAPAFSTMDPDYFALRLFAEILGGGMASRLFQEAREIRGLAYSIDAWTDTYEDTGVLQIFAGAAAGKAKGLSTLVADELRRFAEEGATPAELDRAKAQLQASLFMAEESPLARAEISANRLLLYGRIPEAAEVRAEIDAVTLGDLRRVGERILAPRRAAAAVLGPRAALAAPDAFEKALLA
ncbi:MAG: insulinase family protein [Caulobacteraceae bacterium]|nr:insulinase family protein [Caulobacteraceae bacterium]